KRLEAQETTTPFLLDPQTLVVRSGPGEDAAAYVKGKDYEADLDWGTFGRVEGSRIAEGQPVFVSYRYTPLRLDSVVLTRDGKLELRKGEPRSSAARPPDLAAGEQRLANIWLP